VHFHLQGNHVCLPRPRFKYYQDWHYHFLLHCNGMHWIGDYEEHDRVDNYYC